MPEAHIEHDEDGQRLRIGDHETGWIASDTVVEVLA